MKTVEIFYADWCGPCKGYKMMVEEHFREKVHIKYVNIDENVEYAAKNNIRTVPTTILHKDEVERCVYSGAMSKSQFADFVL